MTTTVKTRDCIRIHCRFASEHDVYRINADTYHFEQYFIHPLDYVIWGSMTRIWSNDAIIMRCSFVKSKTVIYNPGEDSFHVACTTIDHSDVHYYLSRIDKCQIRLIDHHETDERTIWIMNDRVYMNMNVETSIGISASKSMDTVKRKGSPIRRRIRPQDQKRKRLGPHPSRTRKDTVLPHVNIQTYMWMQGITTM